MAVNNKVRVIGGEWRSRLLQVPNLPGLRPTPSRVREMLFNWLQFDIAGSRCLDLFSGCGALGIEAASRGARQVVQVENSPEACRLMQQNLKSLAAKQITCVQEDVFKFLAEPSESFDLVFLDPPFGRNLALQACLCLEQKGWLAGSAKIYVETESNLVLHDIPENWQLLKVKKTGDVGSHLFERML